MHIELSRLIIQGYKRKKVRELWYTCIVSSGHVHPSTDTQMFLEKM